MDTLKATNQSVGFHQRLPMWQSNKRFPYIGPHQHEDNDIEIFFLLIPAHDGNTVV